MSLSGVEQRLLINESQIHQDLHCQHNRGLRRIYKSDKSVIRKVESQINWFLLLPGVVRHHQPPAQSSKIDFLINPKIFITPVPDLYWSFNFLIVYSKMFTAVIFTNDSFIKLEFLQKVSCRGKKVSTTNIKIHLK